MERPHPDREGFGEASLGEAQSANPPPDPEMLRDRDGEEEEAEDAAERGAESYADQDAEPATTEEDVESAEERDQAEG